MQNWQDEYKQKLISAEEAASKVKSGDNVAFTAGREALTVGMAISARLGELQGVKVAVPSPGYDFGWYDEGWDSAFEITISWPTATVQDMLEQGILAVDGNAGDENVLEEAGIDRARGLVAVAASDAENLFITITARSLNKDLFITARAETKETEKKLLRVGADKVVSPYLIGAFRLVNTILKPAVAQFIELSSLEREMDVRIEEIEVGMRSALDDRELKETPIRSELGIIVLAIEKKDGKMLFNPPPGEIIEGGDKLITIGTPDQTEKLIKMAT